MDFAHSPRLTRRAALSFAGASLALGRLSAAGGDFWDKKPPSEWDSTQIEKLLHKSPWAKEVNAQFIPGEPNPDDDPDSRRGGNPPQGGGYPPGGSPPGGGYPPGGMGGPRIGLPIPGIGGIGMPRRNPTGGPRPGSLEKGIVRWESAKPILEAQKSSLPESMAGHYVISVTGIPLRGRDPNQESLEDLRRFATLEPRGRDLTEAVAARRSPASYSTLLFAFSRRDIPIALDDREVLFSVKLGSYLVKAGFVPKEMLYHKELAL